MNVELGGTYSNHYATRGLSEQNLVREEKPANARLSKAAILVAKERNKIYEQCVLVKYTIICHSIWYTPQLIFRFVGMTASK